MATPPPMAEAAVRVRLDKWLWAARFYKTRSLATQEIVKGRVSVNDQVAKAGREVHLGDRIEVRQGALRRCFVVRGLSGQRGPAPVASLLYAETDDSVARREALARERRSGIEPALAHEHGRPTKRDRRQLADWDRWSASLEPGTGER